ncbi:MAG: two-component system, NarL family, sensor histidine kinase BarA, partial [Verrucomicrobiota bacterium]
ALALLFAAAFASRNLKSDIAAIKRRLAPAIPVPAAAAEIIAEDQSFSDFAASFKAAPDPAGTRNFQFPGQTRKEAANAADIALREFFPGAAKDLAIVRRYLSAIGRATDDAGRQKLLVDFSRQIGALKRKATLPALLLIRQMAFAMEGLLNQLAEKPSSVTSSSLRTLTGAVNLMDTLCVPGLNQDVADDAPVRLLAVDDDAIGRRAISFTLEKAFAKPDVAENGETALVLATEHVYDAIFLDVQMPGMDGFQTCSRIHDTETNRTSPVVFVTCLGDFEARAKSTRVEGHELIAKPFLTFEVTLKALTLVIEGRLRSAAARETARLAEEHEATKASPTPAPASSRTPTGSTASIRRSEASTVSASPAVTARQKDSQNVAARGATAPRDSAAVSQAEAPPGEGASSAHGSEQSPENFARQFFTRAPAQVEGMREEFQGLSATTDEEERQDILGSLYIKVHAVSAEAEQAQLHSIFRLSAAMQALLKKLLEFPALTTDSTVETTGAALELLEDLCRNRPNPDLANPPLRVLVVDDDPVARRAISGALQLALEKPDTAESGEAALALAAEKSFDMIFLDILMPGMDGFTTCSKIHETSGNSKTPVVFVTGRSDMESRDQAMLSGGSGFIPKPVMPAEIRVTALTFCLRGRAGVLQAAAGS